MHTIKPARAAHRTQNVGLGLGLFFAWFVVAGACSCGSTYLKKQFLFLSCILPRSGAELRADVSTVLPRPARTVAVSRSATRAPS